MALRYFALSFFLIFTLSSNVFSADLTYRNEIPNRLIDDPAFLSDVAASHELRLNRRVTEDQFVEMAKDPKTIILDARSAKRWWIN